MHTQSDTRDRILATARELFHGRSYADEGVKEICDIAKVQKGSFYHFYPYKQNLAMAVIDDIAESRLMFLSRKPLTAICRRSNASII